jgi:putative phosphoesterase
MKIAILSDGHDGIANIKSAIEQIQKLGAEVLLFCGDFCAPGAGIELCSFKGPIYTVWGNNDGDRINITERMHANHSNVILLKESEGQIELGGRKIAMTHYPKYAVAFARTGDYDLVAFGHDHQVRIETHGKCLAVNPGCLNQVRPSDKMGFALYDTDAHAATLHALDGSFLTI